MWLLKADISQHMTRPYLRDLAVGGLGYLLQVVVGLVLVISREMCILSSSEELLIGLIVCRTSLATRTRPSQEPGQIYKSTLVFVANTTSMWGNPMASLASIWSPDLIFSLSC